MGVGTYSELWVERYKSQGYINIDPVILGCLQKFHPVNWKELDWTSKAARSFLREAIDFGLGNQDLSIPIRGPHGQYALLPLIMPVLMMNGKKSFKTGGAILF